MGSARGLWTGALLLGLALSLIACESEEKIRIVGGHVYLRESFDSRPRYIHDPLCAKCREWRVGGHVYDVDLDGTMTHREDCGGCEHG